MRPARFGEEIAGGVVDAWVTYGHWSQNFYVHDEGIEAFLSVKIAERLHKSFGAETCRVRLEVPVYNIRNAVKQAPVGRPPASLRSAGRIDIVFFDARGTPRGLIEVKRHLEASRFRADVARIVSVLEKFGVAAGGPVRWGALAAMHTIWDSNKKSPEKKLSDAALSVQRMASSMNVTSFGRKRLLNEPHLTATDKLLGCYGVAIILTPKRSKSRAK